MDNELSGQGTNNIVNVLPQGTNTTINVVNVPPEDDSISKFMDEYGDEAFKIMALQAGYIAVPPTIEEFIDDPYFAGKFLGGSLYPTWREELKAIYPNPFYSPYSQVILTGAIGLGKSHCAKVGIAYDLCRMLFLKDPHRTYQLGISKPIVIAFMNTTKTLSESVLFREFNEWLRMSPFFVEQAAKVKQNKPSIVQLPHNIMLVCGSRGSHALGNDIYSGILSELNFQGESHKLQAYNQYTQVLRRMESRFFRGEMFQAPGRLWLDSSKSDETGFLEQHIKHAISDPLTRIVEKAIWEVAGPSGKVAYSGEKFSVFIGDQNRDPMILRDDVGKYNIPESLVKECPQEYYQQADRDIYGFLRDFAGISTWSSFKFMNPLKVRAALKLPMGCGKIEIELDEDPNDKIIDYINLDVLTKGTPYYIHFDLAIKDQGNRCGIALTRCTGQMEIERTNPLLNSQIYQDNIYKTDLVLAIVPKPGKETPLSKMKNFVLDLINVGVKIAGVSADQFQSKQLIQDITQLGHLAKEVSVDRTRDAYDHIKDCILENRWTGPNHPILEREFLELLDLGKDGIDHPQIVGGTPKIDRPSKDLTDAVAGSVWFCSQNTSGNRSVSAMEAFINYQNMQAQKPRSFKQDIQSLQQTTKQKKAW
jgi:hypothetical protein